MEATTKGHQGKELPTLQSQMFKYFGGFVTAAVVLIFAVCVAGRACASHGSLLHCTS